MKIIIETMPDGGFDLWLDGKHTGQLTLGEMLEQLLSLVPQHSKHFAGPGRFGMRTPEEWAAIEGRRQRRREEQADGE